jgi:tetratricopeptide (TPR) repeat protein
VKLAVLIILPITVLTVSLSAGTLEDAQFDLAVHLYQKARYREAIAEFRRLLFRMEPGPYRAGSYYYAGRAYQALEEYDRARMNFALVVDGFPSSRFHHKALYQTGRTDYLTGDYESAVDIFDSYLRSYPSYDLADNSLYWKGESFLEMGRRAEALSALEEVLERYPTGNKADAASFKLRLLDLEDSLAALEAGGAPSGEPSEVKKLRDEITRLREREGDYRAEIEELRNRVELLTAEMDGVKELAAASGDEREREIAEKQEELANLERLLEIKEEALSVKEKELDEEFARLQELVAELEQQSDG